MRKSAVAEGVMIVAIMGSVLLAVSCVGMLLLTHMGQWFYGG